MKVLVKTPLSPYSGYGSDGIDFLTALMNRGCDVYLTPMSVQPPLPQHIAMLLTKELKAPFDLFINHVDPMGLECTREMARAADVTVGWTMWEATGFKKLMAEKDRRTLTKRLEHFDTLVGYSQVDAEVFRPHFKKKPIIVQQGGYNAELWPKSTKRDWKDEKFRFVQHGVLSLRKDPWAAIRAFNEARARDTEFAEKATFALHTTSPGLHSQIENVFPGVRIFYEVWPQELVYQFYESAHCLISPSRGEGKDLPCLEMLSTGGTVIATDFAGHQEWLNDAYSYALPVTMARAVEDHRTDAFNARADEEALTQQMLHLFHNRDEAKAKGDMGAEFIPRMFSWDTVTENLFRKLGESLPEEKAQRFRVLNSITLPREDHARFGGQRD